MCGIAGIWGDKKNLDKLENHIRDATNSIYHRGPDSHGYWIDKNTGLALGHRRLAIVDLSQKGHQPMVSSSTRFVIVFNGEIYNYNSLRKELPFTAWKGHSDTETLLAAIETWGIEKTLQKSYGMFAFSLFDREEKKLILARDRMGEKPLYYGFKDGNFLFSSELKSMFAVSCTPFHLNKKSLFDFFSYSYVPTPASIFEGIYKLTPGHLITLSFEDY